MSTAQDTIHELNKIADLLDFLERRKSGETVQRALASGLLPRTAARIRKVLPELATHASFEAPKIGESTLWTVCRVWLATGYAVELGGRFIMGTYRVNAFRGEKYDS